MCASLGLAMTAGATRRSMLAGLPGLGVAHASAKAGPDAAAATRPRVFDPRDFGAAGDGIADDTAAFRGMYRAMRRLQAADDAVGLNDPKAQHDLRRPPLELVVQLAPGHYRYAWNRWTWGLRRITVLGYGAAVQCTHHGPYDLDQAPLTSNRDHYWTWDPEGPAHGPPSAPWPDDYGMLMQTARPGDEAVVLQPSANAALVRPGAWVLLQSYAQQQYGYPPNMRYFERARVLGVEGGRVRLDRPVRYLHRDDWPEDPTRPETAGRARLVAIDRPDCPFALSQRFFGLTVLPNPNHAVRDPADRATRELLGIAGTLQAQVRDCTLISLGVSQADEVLIEASTFGYVEPDKLVDRLVFRDCTIGEVRECTGVNQLALHGCTVSTTAQLLARDVTVEACTFTREVLPGRVLRAVELEGLPVPTWRMAITGCRFFGADDGVNPPVGGDVWIRVPIDGQEVRLCDDGRVEAMQGPAFASLAAVLSVGWPVMAAAAGPPRSGWCSDIAARGSGGVFTFMVPGGLRPGDVLAAPRLLSLAVQGCMVPHPFTRYPEAPELTWGNEVVRSGLLRLPLRSDMAPRPAWLPGYPRRVRCTVLQPYTGPQEGCFLVLREEPAGLELLIDLRTPGVREVDTAGVRLMPGDSFRIGGVAAGCLAAARYAGAAAVLILPGPGLAAAPAAGTAAEQADFVLEVEVDSAFTSMLARAGLA